MNPEAKTKILEALRSDKYHQITGFLYDSIGREGKTCCCALGVINDVSGLGAWSDVDGGYQVLDLEYLGAYEWHAEVSYAVLGADLATSSLARFWDAKAQRSRRPTKEEVSDFTEDEKHSYLEALHQENSYLHPAVQAWADLDDPLPGLSYQGRDVGIDELNDEFKLTFLEIADLIEAQW